MKNRFLKLLASVIVICIIPALVYNRYMQWVIRPQMKLIDQSPNRSHQSQRKVCGGSLANKGITWVDVDLCLISAYFDYFVKKTRVMGIKNRSRGSNFKCIFCCSNSTLQHTTAEAVVHSDHFDFPYGHTDILCSQPTNDCGLAYVSVNDSSSNVKSLHFLEIKNIQEKHNMEYTFVVCISPMFDNYDKVIQFIQHVEMYKILGAQKIVIYLTNSSSRMEKVLDHYSRSGLLELVQWPIESYFTPSHGWKFPDHPGDIHYFGQIAALNDCVYRNKYKAQYVVINDLDEIAFPVQHENWAQLLEYLKVTYPKANNFMIRSHVFPEYMTDENNTFKMKNWDVVMKGKDLNILEHIYREPDRSWVFNPMKMIVSPQSIQHTSIHQILISPPDKETITLDSNIARLCHFRKPEQPELKKSDLIKDTSFWKYNVSLIENVNEVLQKTGISVRQ
ncbi:uncharacterized protein LOC122790811 [Protopterus annectens]|uniref:uncharacterized protein LOC122790811 n=1 Tax=Protopterus annectens TaxID=7888 RepID=UPI001CF9B874|nr:uncharacterized protein LOC122790811 [Protopterus annectens]